MEDLLRQEAQSHVPSKAFHRRLLSQLQHQQFPSRETTLGEYLTWLFGNSIGLSTAFCLLFFVTGAGAYYVYSSPKITPDSKLYALKRKVESIELGIKTSPVQRSETYLKLADRRLQEILTISHYESDRIDSGAVEEAAQQLEEAKKVIAYVPDDNQRASLRQRIVQETRQQRDAIEELVDQQLEQGVVQEGGRRVEERPLRIRNEVRSALASEESAERSIQREPPRMPVQRDTLPPIIEYPTKVSIVQFTSQKMGSSTITRTNTSFELPRESKKPAKSLETIQNMPTLSAISQPTTAPTAEKIETISVLERALEQVNQTELSTLKSIDDSPNNIVDLVLYMGSVMAFTAGESGTMIFLLQNSSAVEVPEMTLEVRWGSLQNRQIIKAIKPWERRRITLQHTFDESGTYGITVIADPEKKLTERTRANNRLYYPITVQ